MHDWEDTYHEINSPSVQQGLQVHTKVQRAHLGRVILIVATSVHANDWPNDPKATRFSVQYDQRVLNSAVYRKKAAGFRLVDIEAGGGKLGAVWADKNKKAGRPSGPEQQKI